MRRHASTRTAFGALRWGIALAAWCAAGSALAAPATLAPGVLTVCASAAFPPVLFKSGQALVGSDVAFLRGFANSHKLELAFREFAFDGLWLRPGRDECDLAAAGLSHLASRESPGVVWSRPYHTVLRTLLIRRDRGATLRTIADFSGKSIGFVTNSTADLDVRARAPNGAVLRDYAEAAPGIADVRAGTLDAFADGNVTSEDFAARFPELAVIDAHSFDPPEVLAFALRARSGLREALDGYIEANRDAYGK